MAVTDNSIPPPNKQHEYSNLNIPTSNKQHEYSNLNIPPPNKQHEYSNLNIPTSNNETAHNAAAINGRGTIMLGVLGWSFNLLGLLFCLGGVTGGLVCGFLLGPAYFALFGVLLAGVGFFAIGVPTWIWWFFRMLE